MPTDEPKASQPSESKTLGNDLGLILETYSRHMSTGQRVSVTFDLELAARWGETDRWSHERKPLPSVLCIRNLAFSAPPAAGQSENGRPDPLLSGFPDGHLQGIVR